MKRARYWHITTESENGFTVEHTMTKETLENRLTAICGKEISACSGKELYTGLLSLIQEMAKDKESNQGKKNCIISPLSF